MNEKIKILIVEDNENDVVLLLRELIRSGLNYSTEIIQTREEFIHSLDQFMPDLILSDYALPSFDGITAYHLMRKKNNDIPFIIISGTIGDERAVELIKNGITDYVLKDKLITLNSKIIRALKDANELREKRMADENIKIQNEKLFEIAFLQSHQVRVPVANILGLFNLFKFDNPYDPINAEILCKLKISAESLDSIIHEIVKKTSEIRP